MSEWLSYEAEIAGAPALVDVDAALDDPAQRAGWPSAIEVTVTGFETGPDGLPLDSADDALYDAEQRIEQALGERGALAVTLATAGTYRFIAYAASNALEPSLAGAAREAGFQVQSASSSDPGWTKYAAWALHGEALEEARDCAQIDELRFAGDDVSAEHEVDFDFQFADEKSAQAALSALADANWEAESNYAGDGTETLLVVRCTLVPTAESIRDARSRLNAIVARLGGECLGWGSEPVEALEPS